MQMLYSISLTIDKSPKGNTAVYMLYAYTRISSISRKANLGARAIAEARRTTPVSIEHEKELKLGKLLLRFPEVILRVADDLCLGRSVSSVKCCSGTFLGLF